MTDSEVWDLFGLILALAAMDAAGLADGYRKRGRRLLRHEQRPRPRWGRR